MSTLPKLTPFLPYCTPWRVWISAGPGACGLLRAVALITIFFYGGFGLVYVASFGLAAAPISLIPCIVGLIYLACAQRIERQQIVPAYVALVIASLHAGLFLLASSVLGYRTIKMAWEYTHPPARGWVIEDPGYRYWLLAATLLLVSFGIAVLLCISVVHLARFLHSMRAVKNVSHA